MKLKGKVVSVTGRPGSGIGEVIATCSIKEGTDVVGWREKCIAHAIARGGS